MLPESIINILCTMDDGPPVLYISSPAAQDGAMLGTSENGGNAHRGEFTVDELQALWSCTLGPLPSVSKARKRSPGDWVFSDSRIHQKHDATSRTSEPTSENSVNAMFAEFSFYDFGRVRTTTPVSDSS
jgi:hypothetical protein